MAHAGSAATGSRARPPATRPRSLVRWDRLGRAAMLFVLCVLVYLYISPVRSLFAAIGESGRRQADVAVLNRANAQLRAERDALGTPAALERDARKLGLVRPGEREYVIFGLPRN